MNYTLGTIPEFKKIIRVISVILIVVFSASFYSCQTYYTETYTPENMKQDENVTILEVTSKNDSTINLSDYNVMYKENYKDSLSVLWFETIDTNLIKTEPRKEYKITEKINVINLKDISKLKVEKSKFSLEKTLLYGGLFTLAIIVLGTVYFLLSPMKIRTIQN